MLCIVVLVLVDEKCAIKHPGRVPRILAANKPVEAVAAATTFKKRPWIPAWQLDISLKTGKTCKKDAVTHLTPS